MKHPTQETLTSLMPADIPPTMQPAVRRAIRAFLLTATKDELEVELAISIEKGDEFRAEVIRKLIAEA